MTASLDIVVLGLALRSSWGNGHATTYRALLRALRRRGHRVRFLERDVPWYADNQDAPEDLAECIAVYRGPEDLIDLYAEDVANADLVIVGSYVPDGAAVGAWVQSTAHHATAFYDIDTPVTLAKLAAGRCEYLEAPLIPRFDLYLSFTGGPVLDVLESRYGAHALPFYCAVDPTRYAPENAVARWDLGYMGTYSDDRQPAVERLLLAPAREWPQGRFVVAGAQYPDSVEWPRNVARIEHLGPAAHRSFYNRQLYTLNVTRADMVAAGWSPSVRLFEAAACATPVVSDPWDGLDSFFVPGREILIARHAGDVLDILCTMPEERRREIGAAARRRVLAEHTGEHRAETLERYLDDIAPRRYVVRPQRSTYHDSPA
ncbi:MAG TPA: glycosyltransferase [Rudaea sp.]|nr:glycosyltransferase [Rudaea sp.]